MNVVVRAAVVLGCLGVVGLAVGCGAPAETGTEAVGKTDPGLIVINPIFFGPPSLSSVTQPPVDNGATCGATNIAPPTSLAAFGCSYGIEVMTDENMLESDLPRSPPVPQSQDGSTVAAYIWACKSVSSTGATLDDALTAIQNVDRADEPTAFGGPALQIDPPRSWVAIVTTTYTDTCYGAADSGWELVSVTWRNGNNKPGGGCEGDDCGSGDTGSGSGGGTIGSGSGGIIVGGPILHI